ncbi:MAG: S8 family serine peptidase, partial [Anaerolineae bacterium]|nr:S8 family serine peptidase [Anaerolineae bacterium]
MRHRNFIPALLAFALLVTLLGASALPARSSPAWHAQVDRWILDTLADEGEAEFLVFLTSQADLSGAAAIRDKRARGAYVVEQLKTTAGRTQPAVSAALDRLGVAYRPYWIANVIWVRGPASAVEQLAQRGDVARLYANPRLQIDLPAPERSALSPQVVEPSLSHIEAPAVWAMGITGAGVVVAGQDTGYQWDHPALVTQYRGWDGSSADHNYNWHDAIHANINPTPGNPCGFDAAAPCDDIGHGTHTVGTMVGDDGAANQIGVAPGARWIGCRNMEQGAGTPATYIECFQWFVAPTDL